MTHMHGAVMAKPSGAFTPTSISGCQLWLDASDASSFTFSSGSVVSQWNDKSGNGRHMVQGTVANQPTRDVTINGLSAVKFTGSPKNMRTASGSTIAQPWMAFVVATDAGTGGAGRLLANRADVNAQVTIGVLSTNGAVYAGTAFIGQGSAPSANAAQQITVLANGASSQAWGNGTAGSAGNAGSQSLVIGTIGSSGNDTNYHGGNIAELIIYNSSLSSTDRQAVEAYLKAKWGTP